MFRPSRKFDRHRTQTNLLRAVATIEFAKGIFVLMVGILAILLLHKDVWVIAESILNFLRISTERRPAQMFLDLADDITDARLWLAIKLAFIYAGLRFAEGYGLWHERTWAEWVAFLSGMLLFPLEIRELFRGVDPLRLIVFLVNLAVVLYMGYLLREGRRLRRLHCVHSSKS